MALEFPIVWKIKCHVFLFREHGDLFWIEFREKGEWLPIGDVTLSQENLPIVIGNPTYQHQGLGRKVTQGIEDFD